MIAILGESGSGKSTLQDLFVKKHPEYKKVVMFTTRPKRDGESDGKDYHFVSKSAFKRLVKNDFFATFENYNEWYYGIPKADCTDPHSIAVVNPCAFRKLKANNVDMDSIYLYVDRRSRLVNQLLRGDDIEEAYRRNLTEVGQFDGMYNETDYIISNTQYHMEPDGVVTCLEAILDKRDDKDNKVKF